MLLQDSENVRCPYCAEEVELLIDPSTVGTYVEDCAVCCQPWQVTVSRDEGDYSVYLEPAQ